MASTPTTRNRLNLQAQGDNIGSWGTVLNSNVFSLVDEALDGLTTLAITGNVSLTSTNYASDQSRKRILRLTGSPGASYIITIPGVEKYYVVHNVTDAPQQLKAGGLAATVPANTLSYVYCDGTDSFAPSATVNSAIGAIMDFAGSAAPAGWLLCYGQAVSRVTYSSLFQVIGTTYGVGDGSTTFNVPDLRGRASFGKDNMGGSTAGRISGSNSFSGATTLGTAGGDDRAQSHSHAVNITDPGHFHGITQTAHSHGTTESAHGHGLNDTGHTHNYQRFQLTGSGSSVQAGSGFNISDVSTASGGSNNTTAGLTVQGNVTGLTVNTNNANITINSQATGITASSSVQVNGGNSGNMPPALILNKIIYSGV
jgi:microcystin-dependent protein